MKSPQRLVLILIDQLDLSSSVLRGFDPKADEIFMVESRHEAQYVWFHKAKIVLFLSAMRHFAKGLKSLNYPITYVQDSPLSIVSALKEKIQKEGIVHIVCVEPGEWRLKQEIETLAIECNLTLDMRKDNHFFCSRQEFAEWSSGKKELRLEYFYRLMRKRHNVLINADGEPIGGQWNFDQDNRKPYPKKGPGIIDEPLLFEPDDITQEVLQYVQKTYSNHPGSLENFYWPVTRDQALEALHYFVEYRLRNFGVYQDAM